jgi:hypothetical protein
MARMRSAERRQWDDRPASATVSRLIVAGFAVAAALGVLTGAGWMAWTFISRTLGG